MWREPDGEKLREKKIVEDPGGRAREQAYGEGA
jgi:hypothetical protein